MVTLTLNLLEIVVQSSCCKIKKYLSVIAENIIVSILKVVGASTPSVPMANNTLVIMRPVMCAHSLRIVQRTYGHVRVN